MKVKIIKGSLAGQIWDKDPKYVLSLIRYGVAEEIKEEKHEEETKELKHQPETKEVKRRRKRNVQHND